MKYKIGRKSYGYGRYGRKVLTGSFSNYYGWEKKKNEGKNFLGVCFIILVICFVIVRIVAG